MPVIVVSDDSRMPIELANAGANLVVIDFTASWCGPCQRIAPIFEELSNRYSRGAVFLKVDVDRCPDSAATYRVSAMPTFLFMRRNVQLARMQGADPTSLEAKVRELSTLITASEGGEPEGGAASSSADLFDGHMDLTPFIHKNGCECLNQSDDHPLEHCLTDGSALHLESDCDEQLIINLAFSQNVKLHSLKFDAPADSGPKRVRIFINQPRTLDFDSVDSMEATQDLDLHPGDLNPKNPISLRYVKFQNVSNIILFIKNNQKGTETTRLNHLQLIGSPVSTTNMGEFKRVTGKKGESH